MEKIEDTLKILKEHKGTVCDGSYIIESSEF